MRRDTEMTGAAMWNLRRVSCDLVCMKGHQFLTKLGQVHSNSLLFLSPLPSLTPISLSPPLSPSRLLFLYLPSQMSLPSPPNPARGLVWGRPQLSKKGPPTHLNVF